MQKLSKLQNFILTKSLLSDSTNKNIFSNFYKDKKVKPRDMEKIITSSINKLIKRDLVIAHCKKTREKIFIESVNLTARGKKLAKQLLGIQEHLPIKYKVKSTKL
jgi:dihydropteroate synthase